jgi:RNA polymerase sigma-70 factor, ECF subfamily
MTLEQEQAAKDSRDDLVVRARTNREALGQLYDVHYPGVFRYCLRRLFVRSAAEDVTSEVFLRVASKMPHFGGTSDEDFRRWVFRIATNEANAYLRQGKRRRALLESAAQSGSLPDAAAADSRPSDVETLDWPVVYQAILSLKPRDQAILVLRFFEQMSHEQIAGVLNQRPATVRVGLSRALVRLRRCFKLNDDPIRVPWTKPRRHPIPP